MGEGEKEKYGLRVLMYKLDKGGKCNWIWGVF